LPATLVYAAFLVGSLLVAPASRVAAQTLPTSEDCVNCHLTLSDERLSGPAKSYGNDIHAQTGFGCLACHGSGGSDVLDPARGFLSKPERREIPALCGRCHSDGAFMRQFNPSLRTDQVSEYWTSVHGHRLREENDTSVATCVDCHPAHDIRPPTDPESSVYPTKVVDTCGRCHADPERMAPYGIPTDQVEAYKTSVHGKKLLEDGDVSAPVCNDCHGNHGAAPPGLASVRNVCGQCHSVMADFFDQSGHEEIFDEADMPGCVTCHGNHGIQQPADSLLGVKANEICAQCHAPSDAGGHAFQDIRRALDSLDTQVAQARSVLEDAENKGMEVSQALFELEDVTNAETKARNAIHTFHLAPVLKEADPGFKTAATAEERGEQALEEHHTRRVGLGVSAGIIVLLIASLFLKIRDVESRTDRAVAAVEEHFRRLLGGPGLPGRKEARVAASALLLEAAYTDDNLSGADRRFVEGVVRDRFGVSRSDAEELIALLRRERSDAGRACKFAELVGEDLSTDQRDVILEELWRLVFSDETLAEHEVPIMDDLAKLLHVDRDVLAAARRRATATAAGGPRSGMGEDR
jgi:predicted CXXCH cytochrome family protein